MLAYRDLYSHHQACAIDQAAHALMHPRKKSLGGIILLVLILVPEGIYWVLPEIRRYIRLERM